MPNSRPESQQPPISGRKRSNTVQSHFKHVTATPIVPISLAPPLKRGDWRVLNTWVHDNKDSLNVVLNQSYWPGVSEGDIIQISQHPSGDTTSGLLFIVPKDEAVKHQLQVFCFIYSCMKIWMIRSDIDTKIHGRKTQLEKQWRSTLDEGT
jgi:DEP domain-containing protein 5